MRMQPRWLRGPGRWLALATLTIGFYLEYRAFEGFARAALASAALLHGLAALALALGLWRLLPAPLRQPPAAALTLLFCLCLLLPGMGGAGLLLALAIPLHYARPPRAQFLEVTEIPPLPEGIDQLTTLSQYGSGGALGILERSTQAEQRLRAVMTTRKMSDRDAIPILRVALRDPVDEVRLLAYSLIDRKEKRISANISAYQAQLRAADAQHRPYLHGRVAESYWELAYLGLAQGEVLSHILHAARDHALAALAAQPLAAELHFLLGRIALQLDEFVAAHRELEEAGRLGLPRHKLVPYLAELAFATRRLDQVGGYLSELESNVCQYGVLSELEAHWK